MGHPSPAEIELARHLSTLAEKRKRWVSECPQCHDVKETTGAPRERMCNVCHIWVPYIEKEEVKL